MLRLWAGAALFAAALAAAAQAEAAEATRPVRPCGALTGFRLPGTTLQVERAELRPAAPGAAAHCRVDGVIDRRIGFEGRPYAIGFALALPQAWNGRFLFQGGGGLNGTIYPPLGAQAAGDTPALGRGFAVVTTDSGHRGSVFDPSFLRDQEAALNFAHASVGKVAEAAKSLIADYYGQRAHHSYFAGCSTGGREAMLAAQRYPDQFDGVVAGDPAMRAGYSDLALAWAAVAFNQAAPRDAAGRPLAARLFAASDKALLMSSLMRRCDALDGQRDGLIFDVQGCRFDPAALTCRGPKTPACLTRAQVTALNTAFAGARTRAGVQLYPPFPWDSGMASEGPVIPGFLPSETRNPRATPSLALSIDLEAAAARASDGTQGLIDTYGWTNLTSFFGRGGKMLFFHGMSDPWFSPYDTLGYYERLAEANGGAEAVHASSRLFLVPGMSHCEGGGQTLDRFDMLGAVVDWVEAGRAPESVVATGRSMPGQSRPLCAWPLYAHYRGSGEPRSASSYECRRPAAAPPPA